MYGKKNGSAKGFFANWIVDSGMHEVNLRWPVPNDRLQALRVPRLFAAPLGAAAWRSRAQTSTGCPRHARFALGRFCRDCRLDVSGEFPLQ